jgi:ABC-type antimicrobial peptide transport system permease subunit
MSPGILLRLKILRASLASNQVRTVLAGTLVSVGIASTLIMVTLSTGVRREVEAVQDKMGRNLFVVKSGERPVPQWQGTGWYVTSKLKREEAALIEREIPAIERAVPLLERNVPVKLGDTGLATMVRGTTPGYLQLRNFQIEHGRALTDTDEATLSRVAVVGAFIAERLNAGLSLVGETLWVNGIPFEVVGQLRAKGQGSDGSNEDDQILIPLDTALRRVANVDRVTMFLVQTKEAAQLPDAMEATARLLRATHRLDDDERDDFDILSMIRADVIRRMSSEWLQGLARILAVITLSIGGAGIFAVSSLNVKDRTGEIGLRMAIGASRGSIAALFLAEACVMSALGGIAGIVLGTAAATILQRLTSWQMPLDARGLAIPLIVSASIGVIFGTGPAIRASRLKPAAALAGE